MIDPQEVKLINRMIAEAVANGGDNGGAYGSRPERLRYAMERWLEHKSLTREYHVGYVGTRIPEYYEVLQFIRFDEEVASDE